MVYNTINLVSKINFCSLIFEGSFGSKQHRVSEKPAVSSIYLQTADKSVLYVAYFCYIYII